MYFNYFYLKINNEQDYIQTTYRFIDLSINQFIKLLIYL